jgi:uncharacterized membrane protein YtjA (UPF0391 family)
MLRLAGFFFAIGVVTHLLGFAAVSEVTVGISLVLLVIFLIFSFLIFLLEGVIYH